MQCRTRSEVISRGHGAPWLAEDQRVAGNARKRSHRATLDVRRGAPCRSRTVESDRETSARAGDFEMVEGRAPWRLPRLQPERERPDDVLGVFRAPGSRCSRLYTA